MAALTANRTRLIRAVHLLTKGSGTAATSTTIYEGSLLCVVETTGRLVPATAAAARTFMGVAAKEGDNNDTIEFDYNHEERLPSATALTKGFTGCEVGILDDGNVTTYTGQGTAAARVAVGELIEWPSANLAWVAIRRHGLKTVP